MHINANPLFLKETILFIQLTLLDSFFGKTGLILSRDEMCEWLEAG
jgi:hypothetical protein